MNLLMSNKVKIKTNNEELPRFIEILKRLLKISIPAALETLLMGVIGLIDTMMVGNHPDEIVSAARLAAVSICQQPVFITLAISFGINAGITAIVARRKGEQNPTDANKTIRQAIVLSIIVGGIISILSIVFAEPFLRFAGAKDDTIDYAITYFSIVSSILIFNYIRLGLCAALRAEGSTKLTLVTNIIANLVNVCLNYCLINGNLGFPELGVAGAAIATIIGNFVAFLIAFGFVIFRNGFVKISFKESWRFDKDNLSNLVKVSTPAFIEQLFMRIGFFIIALIVNNLGTMYVAMNAIISGIIMLSFNITDGFCVGVASLVGESLGAKKRGLAFAYARLSQIISFFLGLIMIILIFIFRVPLSKLFSSNTEVIAGAAVVLEFAVFTIFPQSLQWVTTGALRGSGDVKFTARTSMLSVAIIRPVLSFILCYPLGLMLLGSWIGMFIDQTIRFLLNNHRLNSLKWMDIKV